MRAAYIFLSSLLLCSVVVGATRKLIVVLVDGVRWDSLHDPKLKGFHRIAQTGVRASYVQPVFPSLSYSNWYSIVTGLYSENHGFVDNYMYDNDTNTFYLMNPHPNATDPIWWNGAEPIWITAEKNHLPTAMYWWGGCEVRIGDHHPTICERERFGPPTPEEREDFLERIDDMVEMFKPSKRYPRDRLSLAMMYYGATDYNAHKFGPNSKEFKDALRDIDGITEKMLNKLEKAGLKDEVSIMIVSDHGMADLSKTKSVDIQRFNSLIKYQVSSGSQSMIIPQDGMLEKLYEAMKQANMNGVDVYKKEDIPEKYHIKHNKRTTPLFLVAREGFLIIPLLDQSKSIGGGQNKYRGGHGYDPAQVKDMRTIFLATGPDFRRGVEGMALNITDLYNVMCHILQVQPLPNNGSWDRVKWMLKKEPAPASTLTQTITPSSAQPLAQIYSLHYATLLLCMLFARAQSQTL